MSDVVSLHPEVDEFEEEEGSRACVCVCVLLVYVCVSVCAYVRVYVCVFTHSPQQARTFSSLTNSLMHTHALMFTEDGAASVKAAATNRKGRGFGGNRVCLCCVVYESICACMLVLMLCGMLSFECVTQSPTFLLNTHSTTLTCNVNPLEKLLQRKAGNMIP